LFASHDGLEEEAERRLHELRVCGDRRVDVEEELAPNGHQA
jgi:hypothetical protein